MLTADEAAAVLGVSSRRVHQLVRSGRLPVVGGQGGRMRLPADVVRARAETPVLPGRPWSNMSVWAAAWLLDGREPDWLHDRTLRRVRAALPGVGDEGVRTMLRRITTASGFEADTALLERVASEPGTAARWLAGRTLLVCLPAARAAGLPARFGLRAGYDLTVVAADGWLPRAAYGYVPSALG